MKTLLEHIDDLDRMVDTNASKPDVRNQIAFIQKQVAALEFDVRQAAEACQALQSKVETVQQENAALQDAEKRRSAAALNRMAKESDIPETYTDRSL